MTAIDMTFERRLEIAKMEAQEECADALEQVALALGAEGDKVSHIAKISGLNTVEITKLLQSHGITPVIA